MSKSLTIIFPVYNDWESIKILLKKIDTIIKTIELKIKIVIVNDGSNNNNEKFLLESNSFAKIFIINLHKNVGSQRAIGTAIKYLNQNNFDENYIIMDSDGEDDPEKILEIIKSFQNSKIDVITVNRTKRNGPLLFSILYEFHLLITFCLTFKYIRFGNYSYLSKYALEHISTKKELWMAYSATLAKFFKKKGKIFALRKERIIGKSKMSYFNLFLHSLRILSVFKKNIFFSSSAYLMICMYKLNFELTNNLFLFVFIFYFFINISIQLVDRNDKKISFFNCLDNIRDFKSIK